VRGVLCFPIEIFLSMGPSSLVGNPTGNQLACQDFYKLGRPFHTQLLLGAELSRSKPLGLFTTSGDNSIDIKPQVGKQLVPLAMFDINVGNAQSADTAGIEA